MSAEDAALTLLVVDDDEHDRENLRRALRAAGCNADIDELPSGERALDLVRARAYDCVILDRELPGEDGLSVLRRLRAAGSDVPVLVVATRLDETVEQMFADGASDYLVKSDISPARLVHRLRHAIRAGRAEVRAREAVAALAAERQLLETVLRQMPAAVVVVDPAGQRFFANDQARELLGAGVDAQLVMDARMPLGRAMAAQQPLAGEELELVRPDGRRAALRASATPIVNEGGGTLAGVMILDDVTAERRAQEQLALAVSARDELLAIVSHDLRNPLNAVSVAVDELGDPRLDETARATYVGAVRRALGRAERLIRDLLEISRIEAGRLTVEPRAVDVRKVLEQAAREHEVLAREANLAIEVQVEPGVGQARADRDRLQQLLGNLIGNALRYARGKGPVTLAARMDGADTIIEVADRGPGIGAELLERIFDRFWQAKTRGRAGAGLGLAIARGIAVAHGGELTVENRGGGGALFRLRLPGA